MKSLIRMLVLSVVLGMGSAGWAAIDFSDLGGGSFSASASPSATISDYGTGIPGPSYSLSFNFAGYSEITAISITFTTSGGWNGDLYAYLSHGSDFAVLLNRVGANATGEAGYGTSGFNNITLAMSGTDIHGVQSPTTGGTYASDGRADYTSATRNNTLNVFGSDNPNGSWTLQFQDMAAGDVAMLSSFSVNITALTAVPEPVTVALGVFGVAFAGVAVGRRFRVRARASQ